MGEPVEDYMSSEEDSSTSEYLEDVPKWCLTCNAFFDSSIGDHAMQESHQENYEDPVHARWDAVRLDRDVDWIIDAVKGRNSFQHTDEDILLAIADHDGSPVSEGDL